MRAEPLPAVSVALVRGDRVLLVRRGRAPKLGFYAFPGGRVEAGEDWEAAARRELAEETGLSAGSLAVLREYHVEQEPNGAPVDFILRVYAGKWAGGEPVASDDAAEAGWFSLAQMEKMPVIPSVREVAGELLARS